MVAAWLPHRRQPPSARQRRRQVLGRRHADGRVVVLFASTVSFVPRSRWRSPRTGTEYPVSVQVRAGEFTLDLVPLMDDQEFDSRASTGAIY